MLDRLKTMFNLINISFQIWMNEVLQRGLTIFPQHSVVRENEN